MSFIWEIGCLSREFLAPTACFRWLGANEISFTSFCNLATYCLTICLIKSNWISFEVFSIGFVFKWLIQYFKHCWRLVNLILGDSKKSILVLSFEAAKLTENAYVAWLYKLFEYKNYLNKEDSPANLNILNYNLKIFKIST